MSEVLKSVADAPDNCLIKLEGGIPQPNALSQYGVNISELQKGKYGIKKEWGIELYFCWGYPGLNDELVPVCISCPIRVPKG